MDYCKVDSSFFHFFIHVYLAVCLFFTGKMARNHALFALSPVEAAYNLHKYFLVFHRNLAELYREFPQIPVRYAPHNILFYSSLSFRRW